MPARASGHLAVGLGSSVLGAAALAMGTLRIGFVDGSFLGTPLWALFLTGGSVLALAGVLVVVFAVRGEEEPVPVVPAHVAFHSRMEVAEVAPPAPVRTVSAAAPARLPSPEAPAQRRVAPTKPDFGAIDAEIRELTRQISKAGVMLATGQLSQHGYLAYVDDLKRKRGSLEAQRVRAELSR